MRSRAPFYLLPKWTDVGAAKGGDSVEDGCRGAAGKPFDSHGACLLRAAPESPAGVEPGGPAEAESAALQLV